MQIVNKIIEGVHSDNDPNNQPEHTMRKSVNGVIMDAGNGNYIWQSMKGTDISFELQVFHKIIGWCIIRERFIIILINEYANLTYIFELEIDSDGIATQVFLWSGDNTAMNFSVNHPIRAMFGFYETQEIQRIYLTDYNNSPMVINIGYSDPYNKSITINEKFLPFTPNITGAYGTFQLDEVLAGGVLKAGNHFFCWRYSHDNYFSDWSYLTNPITVSPGIMSVTPDGYQDFQGGAPDEITNKAIKFILSDLDNDYDYIQIAAFYSNDYNSAGPGTIFYDGGLTGTSKIVTYYGNENVGVITLEEILDVSLRIDKCKDMTLIRKRNSISNITTREELDMSSLNAAGKNNQIDCQMSITSRDVILDITGYPGESWAVNEKGMFQSPVGSIVTSIMNPNMYCGIQYRGLTSGGAILATGAAGTISWGVDEIFVLDDDESEGATCTSGTCDPVIALKKYRHALASVPSTWDEYEWDVKSLVGEFLDFKSPVVANMIRGYPGGETIRLGLVCFDHTGRPFYARWLNNTDATLGVGDPLIPKRNEQGTGEPLIAGYDVSGAAPDFVYSQVNGRSLGIKIGNLNLTDIIDDISAFMIVRVPIVHQYLGMGLIAFTYKNGSNVHPAAGFIQAGAVADAELHPGTYAFYCPEDMFGLKDFVIQPGDKIENLQYLTPYDIEEIGETAHQGFGTPSVPDQSANTEFNLYQKFMILNSATSPGGDNSDIGVEHEVLYSTKYNVNDGGELVFDPRNEALKYMNISYIFNTAGTRYGVNGRHNILVLDIDQTGNNPKGLYQRAETNAGALLCSVRRAVSSIYGGTSDASLANSLYLSVGHFQVINDTVKADINTGGSYIFNEIEIFGGDSYVNLVSIQRVLLGVDIATPSSGHGVIFPVESRVNIALREGIHLGKDRPYESATNPNGIRHEVGSFNFEEYNYNDGYSSDNINDYYLPIPFNTVLINKFDVDIRFSSEKSHGERQDKFRIFNANDKITLSSEYGEIVNIRSKFNRLIYWQRDAIGYIPISERALSQGQFGDPVQLGVGGVFERYDEMTDRIGNSNQFGLVESDMGFHWYDAKRKMYLTLTDALKFSQDSIAKGLNNWIEENIDFTVINYDNPMVTGGVCGGYDPYYKVIFYSFINPVSGITNTIGYDIRLQKYIGEFTMPGGFWMRYNDLLFSVKKGEQSINVHSKGDIGNIYGTEVDSEIQIVIKNPNHESLVYDFYEIIGNDKFFDEITVENSDQSLTEEIQRYLSGEYRFLNGNYKYRNRRWFANFPKVSRERLVDGYLIVTFKSHAQLIKFLEMKTTVRKAY